LTPNVCLPIWHVGIA